MRPIFRVVDEAAKMNTMRLGKMFEDIEGTDFVAFVGRIGNPLTKKKHVLDGLVVQILFMFVLAGNRRKPSFEGCGAIRSTRAH